YYCSEKLKCNAEELCMCIDLMTSNVPISTAFCCCKLKEHNTIRTQAWSSTSTHSHLPKRSSPPVASDFLNSRCFLFYTYVQVAEL
ncbi:hypothetical protein TorRG33x02_172280, partial [Trema orientale]